MDTCAQNNALDFQDPGAIDHELLVVPGFVGKLTEHTLAVSPRPNPVTAFTGALAMQAFLAGSGVVDKRGLHTNLYLAALAPTGMGKEEPRVTNKILASKAGLLGSVPDAIATGEALDDAIAASPTLLLQCDEADSLLTAMRGNGTRAAKLNEMLLSLHSESKSGHATRLKAGDGKSVIVPYPSLTLFATGIGKFVYQAITPKALENGLLGRCIFLETDEFRPLGEGIAQELPADVVDIAMKMSARERAFREGGCTNPVVIGETPEATMKIKELRYNADEISKRLYESGLETGAAIYCRLYEKTLKLAAHHAISANWEKPVMTLEGVAWANRLATHLTKSMLYQSQFYVAEGSFDKLKKRALALIAKHGGQIDRTTLLQNMHIDATTLKRIVTTLSMCDLIESEMLSSGKVVYSIRKAA